MQYLFFTSHYYYDLLKRLLNFSIKSHVSGNEAMLYIVTTYNECLVAPILINGWFIFNSGFEYCLRFLYKVADSRGILEVAQRRKEIIIPQMRVEANSSYFKMDGQWHEMRLTLHGWSWSDLVSNQQVCPYRTGCGTDKTILGLVPKANLIYFV